VLGSRDEAGEGRGHSLNTSSGSCGSRWCLFWLLREPSENGGDEVVKVVKMAQNDEGSLSRRRPMGARCLDSAVRLRRAVGARLAKSWLVDPRKQPPNPPKTAAR
jgi:hypothetical protein